MQEKRNKDINARRKKRHKCSKKRKRDTNAGRKEKRHKCGKERKRDMNAGRE